MAITLQDPTRTRDRTTRYAFPDIGTGATLSDPPTIVEELLDAFRSGGATSETTFELVSPGGHVRTVTGTVVFLDEEAQTFMVRTPAGQLMRVPLRDVTSAQGEALGAYEELRSGHDGTGRQAMGLDGRSRRVDVRRSIGR